jgi:hypothetical protein
VQALRLGPRDRLRREDDLELAVEGEEGLLQASDLRIAGLVVGVPEVEPVRPPAVSPRYRFQRRPP